MRWLKRITVTLISLLVLTSTIVFGLLLYLDDEDYRNITVSLIEKYTDYKVTISGKFTADISLTSTIQASLIQLHDTDNRISTTIGQFSLSIELSSLFSNNLWINTLEVNDINITVNQTIFDRVSSIALTQEQDEIERFMIPVLEYVNINNISLNVKKEGIILNNFASLSNLSLKLDKSQNMLILNSRGQFNGYQFDSSGKIGNLSDIIKSREPLPINLSSKVANTYITIDGEISEPILGTGANLDIKINSSDLLKFFRDEKNIPFIGSLTAEAIITGDLSNVSIKNINVKVLNSDKAHLTISGNIPELTTGKNIHLKVTSQLDDPDIYSWLIPNDWPKIKTLKINTVIKNNNDGDYTFTDIDIASTLTGALKFNATGSAVVKNISSQPFKDINLELSAEAASMKYIHDFVSKDIPEFGLIKINAKLVKIKKHFALHDIIASAGSPEKIMINAEGNINYISLNSIKPVREIKLHVITQAKDLKILKKYIDTPLPDVKNIILSAEFYDEGDTFSLRDIELKAGDPNKPSVKIVGELTNFQTGDGLRLNTSLDIETSDLLKDIISENKVSDLGTTKGTFSLNYKDKFVSLDEIDITLIKPDSIELNAKGSINKLLSERIISIKTTSKISEWKLIETLLKTEKLGFSSESGTGEISGDKNKITFRNTIKIGQTGIDSEVIVSNKNNRYTVDVNVNSEILDFNDFGIKPKVTSSKAESKNNDKKTNEKSISNNELPFDKIKAFDLNASLKIKGFSGDNYYIKGLDVNLKIKDGGLRVHPAILIFDDGNVQLDLAMSGKENHKSHLKIYSTDVNVGSIMAQFQTTPVIKGYLNALIDLKSSGKTFEQIAINATGDITIVGENIEVIRKYTEILVSDTLGWATSSIGLNKKYTEWSCTILKFKVSNSNLKSETLIVDGPDILINGDLSFNLRDETINMELWPEQKNTLWKNIRPIKMTGSIQNPKVNTLEVGTSNAARTYGELILAPQIFLPLRAYNYVSSSIRTTGKNKDGPCQKLERELFGNKKK